MHSRDIAAALESLRRRLSQEGVTFAVIGALALRQLPLSTARSLADLASPDTDVARARGVYVVHCRDGVPLGTRWVDAGVWRGAAVVDSPDFAPDPQTIASRSIRYLQGILEDLRGK